MGKVLIFGTSLASYRAAVNFARAGHKVILLNRGEFLWHKKEQLQYENPRDIINGYSKGVLKTVAMMTGNIKIYNNSELIDIDGNAGKFKVKFKTRLPVVDEFKCIGCDICLEKCNAKHIPMPLGPGVYFVEEPEKCLGVCPAKAINIPKEEEKEEEVEVVVLSPEYEPNTIDKFAKNIENIMSFEEFDSLFSGKGVDKRFLKRKDGKYPRRLGFFDPAGFEGYLGSYEEQVIMFREAIEMKGMDENLEIHIFLKEVRLYGHNQMYLYDEAIRKGINVHLIEDIKIEEKDGNVMVNDTVLDLLAIMPGQKVPEEWEEIGKIAGIELENGFAKTKAFSFETTRDGIFAIGEFVKPLGSTESFYQGTAIIPEAEKYLTPPEKEEKEELEWKKDDFNPKVGVFICGCAEKDLNMDIKADYVSRKDFLCLRGEEIVKEIKENGINRVVFGACSPSIRGALLEKIAMSAGVHPSYIEIVQLREYVTRVGGNKAKGEALLRAAIAKAKKDYFVDIPTVSPKKSIAIIGGDLAGLIAAKNINGKVPVYIITEKFDSPHEATGVKENTLNMSEDDLKLWYENLKKEALKNAKWIKGDAEKIEGSLGDFKIKIGDETLEAGAIIIATGGDIIEKGTHITGRLDGNTLHSSLASIIAKRKNIKGTYDFMRAYSLLDLNPPEVVRGKGEPVAIVRAREYNKKIAEMLGLKIDKEGFFYFAEEPLHLVERGSIQFMLFEEVFGGIFVAGLAHRPMSIEEEMEEAGFASQSALYLMRDITSPAGKLISVTDPRRCAGCGICVNACFTGARFIDEEEKIAKVHPALCMGCGACVNACPSGAAKIVSFNSDGIFEMIKEVVK